MQDTEIQKNLNKLVDMMLAKEMLKPDAQFTLKANDQPYIYLRWEDPNADRFNFGENKIFRYDTFKEAFDATKKWVSELPSPEETKLKQFMTAVAKAIEIGTANGIDVDFLNPLADTMKKLSSNIITDQSDV